MSEQQHWCNVAESFRRDIDVRWNTYLHQPRPEHWASLRITHYQHSLINKFTASGTPYKLPTAKNLHPYSCYVLSAPFFHPTPLASMRDLPIASIIAKTVPNRCQVRSLVLTVQKLLYSDMKARVFLEECIMCSLLGLFPGSRPPCLKARQRLIEKSRLARSQDGMNPSTDSSIVAQLLRDELHQCLFFALKESLIYMVNVCVPTLAEVLRQFHQWDKFCELILKNMNDARATMTGSANDLRSFEQSVSSLSRQVIRKLFSRQPSSRDFEGALLAECEKSFTEDSKIFKSEFTATLKKYALLVPGTQAPLEWLLGMAGRLDKTPEEQIRRKAKLQQLCRDLHRAKAEYLADGSKTRLKTVLSRAGTWDDMLVDIFALAQVFKHKATTHWIQLPVHITVQQIRALRRVFKVHNGTPLSECPKLMGIIGLCEECSSIRSFLTPKRGKASNGLVAFGFSQSLVSDEELGQFYCARKKATPDRSTSARSAKTGRALRHSRHFGNQCANTLLKQLNLIGRILMWRSRMYAICCYCANFFCLENSSWHGNSLCCGECVDDQGRLLFDYQPCGWCLKQFRALKLTSIFCSDKKEHKLCKQCCRQEFFAPPFTLSWKDICNTLSGCKSAGKQY